MACGDKYLGDELYMHNHVGVFTFGMQMKRSDKPAYLN